MRKLSQNRSAIGLAAILLSTLGALILGGMNNASRKVPQPVSAPSELVVLPTLRAFPTTTPSLYTAHCVSLPDDTAASTPLISGNAYVVSMSGSDHNPGTLLQPWRTIQYAVDHVKAGDTICVRAGTYSEHLFITTSGAQGDPITLTTYNSETAKIDGGAFSAIHTSGHGEDYWEIDGLILVTSSKYALELGDWDCVKSPECHGSSHWDIHNTTIRGAVFINGSHNLFESNEVDGSRHTGDENGVLEAGFSSHHNTYRGNEVHHFRQRGFWSELFTHNNLWENNYVHDIWGDDFSQGIDMDGYRNVEWKHVARGNRIERVSGLAIQLENTFASLVENNVIEAPRRQGIVVINYSECQVDGEQYLYGGENCIGAVTNNILRQNLIYKDIDWGGIISYGAGGIQILGNTIAETNGPCIDLRGQGTTPQIVLRSNILSCKSSAVLMDTLSSFIMDGRNLFDPRSAAYEVRGDRRYSLSRYNVLTGQSEGSMQIDPLFVNASANDFRLKPGSPAIDTGAEIGASRDLAGTLRPQGASCDIGAFEFVP